MSKDEESIVFRVKWSFDANNRDGELFRYLESLGNSRQSAVLNSLRIYYYPEIAFLDGEPNEQKARLVRAAIMQLEERAAYFRRLLGESSTQMLPANRPPGSVTGIAKSTQFALKQPDSFLANAIASEDEDEDDEDEELDNPYDDDL